MLKQPFPFRAFMPTFKLDAPVDWSQLAEQVKTGQLQPQATLPGSVNGKAAQIPLLYAALHAPGNDLFRACLEVIGMRPNARVQFIQPTPMEQTPSLIDAVRHDAHLLALLRQGLMLNVRCVDASGDTPIHRAAFSGWRLSLRWLLKEGVDLQVRNSLGETPLHAALRGPVDQKSWAMRKAILGDLVDAGSDLQARDRSGRTVLVRAAGERPALVPVLLDLGADMSESDVHGRSAADYLEEQAQRDPIAAWVQLRLAEAAVHSNEGSTDADDPAGSS